MKKLMVFSLFAVLLISMLGFAIAENSNESDDDTNSSSDDDEGVEIELENEIEMDDDSRNKSGGDNNMRRGKLEEIREMKNEMKQELKDDRREMRMEFKNEMEKMRFEFRERMREHNGTLKIRLEGKNITISELSDERKEIIAGKINARTGLNITADDIGNGTLGEMLRVYLSNGAKADVKIMPDRAAAIAMKRLRAHCVNVNCSVELKEVGTGNKTRAAWVVETEKDSRVLLIFKNKMKVMAEVDPETGEIISIKKPWWAFFANEDDASEAEIESEVETETEVNYTG